MSVPGYRPKSPSVTVSKLLALLPNLSSSSASSAQLALPPPSPQKPVDQPVCMCSMPPPKTEPSEPCTFESLEIACSHDGRKVTTVVVGPTQALEVVAGSTKNLDKIECKITGLKGPCAQHKGKVFDDAFIEDPNRKKNDTQLTFSACSEPVPLLETPFAFLWPSAPPLKTHSVLAYTHGRQVQDGAVVAYPDIKWNIDVGFQFKKVATDATTVHMQRKKISKTTTWSEHSIDKEEERHITACKVSVHSNGWTKGLDVEFRDYIDVALNAVSKVNATVNKVRVPLQAIGGAKVTFELPRIAVVGVWGWEEIKNSPKCGFGYDISLGLNPLWGVNGELDLLGFILNSTGPLGGTLNDIRKQLAKNEGAKLEIFLTGYAVFSITANFKWMKKPEEVTGVASGELAAPFEFGLKGGGSFEGKKWGVKAGGGAEIGGKATFTPRFAAVADSSGPYLQGEVEFSGFVVYYSWFYSIGRTSKEAGKRKRRKDGSKREKGAAKDVGHKGSDKEEWVFLKPEKPWEIGKCALWKNAVDSTP